MDKVDGRTGFASKFMMGDRALQKPKKINARGDAQAVLSGRLRCPPGDYGFGSSTSFQAPV
jgi:hypothetical protein